MSAHRYQAAWRSITFNRVYDDTGLVDQDSHLVPAFSNSDYRLESLDLVRVSVQDYRELRQYLEGAEPNEAYEGVRMLLLRGKILASSAGDLEDKSWAMYEAFSPATCRAAFAANNIQVAGTPPAVGPFTFKRDIVGGSRALQFYCRPATGRPIIVGRMREGLSRSFLAQLVAFDARAYSQAWIQGALADLTGGPNAKPNNGNIYTHPVIYITRNGGAIGSAGVVTMTNVTTGQQIGFDLSTTGPGETFVIETAASKIYRQSDNANRYSLRTAGFLSQFVLAPGANNITWSAVAGLTQVWFEYRDAYA